MVERLLRLSRAKKKTIILALDMLLLPICLSLAFALRLGEAWPSEIAEFWWLHITAPLIAAPIFVMLGLYRPVLRYIGPRTFQCVLKAVTLHVLVLIALMLAIGFEGFPRSVLGIYWLLCLLTIAGARSIGRNWLQYRLKVKHSPKKVIIFGAGEPGAELAHALHRGADYIPVALVDDRRTLHGSEVHGLSVYPTDQLKWLVERDRVKEILLAIPFATRARRRAVLSCLESLPVSVKTIPSLRDLLNGRAGVGDVRDIEIEDLLDLLGRRPVAPNQTLLIRAVYGKSVMVTGAGGSIGSELCRQICRLRPKRLVLFEISEYALYEIQRELEGYKNALDIDDQFLDLIPVLGSVCDERRLSTVIRALNVDTIYHAAAYKHVPLVEHNPIAGIRNNVFGTWHVARAAMMMEVDTFILISTDKAVRPTNVMGAAKRMAEMIIQGLAAQSARTCFSIVRFGNVLGSSGSVVPLFREQIAVGGPVTVTHPEVIRYFMTIPEAANLVIQAGAMAKGGEVFVLDMGKPIKILDLAYRMIRLSGLQVRDHEHLNGDIAIEFTGLRPGEKLHEELLLGHDVITTDHPLIMCAQEVRLPWGSLTYTLHELQNACRSFDSGRVRSILLVAVAEYRPQCNIPDPIWRDYVVAAKVSQPSIPLDENPPSLSAISP